jgi:hypothetical protein
LDISMDEIEYGNNQPKKETNHGFSLQKNGNFEFKQIHWFLKRNSKVYHSKKISLKRIGRKISSIILTNERTLNKENCLQQHQVEDISLVAFFGMKAFISSSLGVGIPFSGSFIYSIDYFLHSISIIYWFECQMTVW